VRYIVGSSPGRVKPKTIKLVCVASPLSTHHSGEKGMPGWLNLYIEEQTTEWPTEKVQKDKKRSTKYTHEAKDRVTRTSQNTDSYYPFGICWPLCCLFFFDLRILITLLVSVGHCVVCSSSIYGFLLPLWYLQTLLATFINYYFFCCNNIYLKRKNRQHNGQQIPKG
jgi:hypothetical protein